MNPHTPASTPRLPRPPGQRPLTGRPSLADSAPPAGGGLGLGGVRWVALAVGASMAVALAGCGRDEAPLPAPTVTAPDQTPPATAAGTEAIRQSIPGAVLDPSVPPASAVFGAASEPATQSSAKTQASPGALTRTEEANAMPLPGQANSHSTPATPGKAADASSAASR